MAKKFDHFRYTMYSINMTTTTVSQTVGCVKAATEILGDKWTPQLLRFFINEEVVRFCQLQDLVGGINPRTLSARLLTLEEHDVIEKIPSQSTRCEYQLTNKGKDLLPILQDMEQWSDKYAASHV
jgi:DNA-binding HxlR family transcriptional regulator